MPQSTVAASEGLKGVTLRRRRRAVLKGFLPGVGLYVGAWRETGTSMWATGNECVFRSFFIPQTGLPVRGSYSFERSA